MSPQRKRCADELEEVERPPVVIKRQYSERTLMANELEHCHLTGNASPRVRADQVPSLSYNDAKIFQKSSEVERRKTEIEREPDQSLTKADNDEVCLSDDEENEPESLAQTTMVQDVPDCTSSEIFQKSSEVEGRETEIKRERDQSPTKADIDEVCLSDDEENEPESIAQTTMVQDVPDCPSSEIFQKSSEVERRKTEIKREPDQSLTKADNDEHNHEDNPDNQSDYQCGQDEVDFDVGFPVHIPARACQFDSPRPFGARLRQTEDGYHLAKVLRNSDAHRAGLKESDIITHLNEIDLVPMGNDEIQKRFMDVDKVFSLTILRLCHEGGKTHLKKIKIIVTIGEEVVVEVVNEEVDLSRQPRYHGSSAMTYVYQDEDGAQQIYLNTTESGVTMGSYSDGRAQFYLDFFSVLQPIMPSGQPCTIRNARTNQVYDPMQNTMKTVKNYKSPDQTFILDRIPRQDRTFVFESISNRGYYLINESSSGTLKLSQFRSIESIPLEGSFYTTDVKASSSG